MPVAESLVTRD